MQASDFLADEGPRAMKFVVPGIGDFWIVSDNDAAEMVQAEDNLPILSVRDLAYVMARGDSREKRFELLRRRVIMRSRLVQAILAEFKGSKVISIGRDEGLKEEDEECHMMAVAA